MRTTSPLLVLVGAGIVTLSVMWAAADEPNHVLPRGRPAPPPTRLC
jgi:hypothetical protein